MVSETGDEIENQAIKRRNFAFFDDKIWIMWRKLRSGNKLIKIKINLD